MNAAIAELEAGLESLVTNEPIHRADGLIAQADLDARNAAEIRAALTILKS